MQAIRDRGNHGGPLELESIVAGHIRFRINCSGP